MVLALPRGGLPVAAPIATALGAPLDVIVTRKVGHPLNPELAIGAITARGTLVLNDSLLAIAPLPGDVIRARAAIERREAERREQELRSFRAMERLSGRTAILVDDGIATGMTMRSAILDARALGPARIVVAAPVIAAETAAELQREADDVIYVVAPRDLGAISQFYLEFPQVDEDAARAILRKGATAR